VILAAGYSRRLGRPKQTLVIGGETLVERSVKVAQEAGLSPVIAVVRPESDFGFALQQMGAVVVLNDEAREGMAASIRYGVNAAQLLHAVGVVVTTCDQPGLRPEHIRALIAEPERVTGSRYAGRVGVPAYFPASVFDQLMALQGDMGARDLLRGAKAIAAEELALDVDTDEDAERARRLLEESTDPKV
jgi:molybdenum cofactor cytidylyltransferase